MVRNIEYLFTITMQNQGQSAQVKVERQFNCPSLLTVIQLETDFTQLFHYRATRGLRTKLPSQLCCWLFLH